MITPCADCKMGIDLQMAAAYLRELQDTVNQGVGTLTDITAGASRYIADNHGRASSELESPGDQAAIEQSHARLLDKTVGAAVLVEEFNAVVNTAFKEAESVVCPDALEAAQVVCPRIARLAAITPRLLEITTTFTKLRLAE